jgi:gas vesicle protein
MKPTKGLDAGRLVAGALLGMVLGGLVALFRIRRSGPEARESLGEGLREIEEAITRADPVSESIAEGKAAAQRRRAASGFDG